VESYQHTVSHASWRWIFSENVLGRKRHTFVGLSPKFNTANDTASRPSPMATYLSKTGSPEDAGLACKKMGERMVIIKQKNLLQALGRYALLNMTK
jgi:hypothetical protein